ncbi:MAG: LuxR C-terminal-related transcriptional regulator [Rhodospirillaceae bacterium]|nr:LuxR C-terminal-related transcriptional regulator [Rhodospirillaceae bacterium]
MSGRDRFDRILASLHDAVLDDARWPACSALIDEACRTRGNMLSLASGQSQDQAEIYLARLYFRGERNQALEREYLDVYYPRDERIPRLIRLPDSDVVHVASLFTEEEMKTSATYNELLPTNQFQNGVHVRMDGPDGTRITFSTADPVDGEGWSFDQIETIRALLPHFRQYVTVRQVLCDARALAASAVGLLGNDRLGVIQLDRRGRVMAANDRAGELLNGRNGLGDEDGSLRASLLAEDVKLQKLLGGALPYPAGAGASGSMLVSREEPLPRIVVHVLPAREDEAGPRGTRLGALVLVDDPARTGIDPERVGAALGLTPAESHIAVLLAQGRSVGDIATGTGRSRTTVKWHVRNIYGKHGISRQAELAQLLRSVADVAEVRA